MMKRLINFINARAAEDRRSAVRVVGWRRLVVVEGGAGLAGVRLMLIAGLLFACVAAHPCERALLAVTRAQGYLVEEAEGLSALQDRLLALRRLAPAARDWAARENARLLRRVERLRQLTNFEAQVGLDIARECQQ